MATQQFDISPSQSHEPLTPNQPIVEVSPARPLKATQVFADNPEIAALNKQVREKYFGELEIRLRKMAELSKSSNDWNATHDLVAEIIQVLQRSPYDVIRTYPLKRPRAGRKTKKIKNRK